MRPADIAFPASNRLGIPDLDAGMAPTGVPLPVWPQHQTGRKDTRRLLWPAGENAVSSIGGTGPDSTFGGLHPDFIAYHKANTPGYVPPGPDE